MKIVATAVAVTVILVSTHATFAELLFDGPEFQINTETLGSQQTSPAHSVAGASDGSFVVVWQSNSFVDDDGYRTTYSASIQAQRFDALGNRAGAQFRPHSEPLSAYKWSAAVDMAADGEFVIVWQDYYYEHAGRRYHANGGSLMPEFRIPRAFTEYPRAAVALQEDGSFMVVWGDYGALRGLRFDSENQTNGDEFMISETDDVVPSRPTVTSTANGGFLVSWRSNDPTPNDEISLRSRLYDGTGDPGPVFQVNTETLLYQHIWPTNAARPDGSALIVWESERSAGDDDWGKSIQGRWLDSSGVPKDEQFQVNSYTTDYQRRPGAAASADGRILVVWDSLGSVGDDSDRGSVQGQLFDASSARVGTQFQINTYTTSYQILPAVASVGESDFVVVWTSTTQQDGDGYGVFGQRLCTDDNDNRVCDRVEAALCGDYDADGKITLRDAFSVLYVVFGIHRCPACICAVTGGSSSTTSDVLALLRTSIGLSSDFECPACVPEPADVANP